MSINIAGTSPNINLSSQNASIGITGQGGGIVSDHAQLTHLDYVNSGHTGFATAEQGTKADTSLQPNDNITELTNNAEYQNATQVNTAIIAYHDNTKEDVSNKVTSISSSSTNTQYPSAKCVYDIVGNIETAINTIRGVV